MNILPEIPKGELECFKSNVKEWIDIDEEVNDLNNQIKELKKKKNIPIRAINAIYELEERYGCTIREDCLSNWCSIRNRRGNGGEACRNRSEPSHL